MTEGEFIGMLESRGVPPDLIPRLVDRRRDDHRRRRNKEAEQLFQDDKAETERERIERAAYGRWLLFLIFIFELDEKNPRSFLHEAFRLMHDRQERPHPILGEQAFIERSLSAVALSKYPREDVEEALQHGCCAFQRTDKFDRGDVTLTLPMAHAQRSMRGDDSNTTANHPKPAPALELEPVQEPSELDEDRKKLASPDF